MTLVSRVPYKVKHTRYLRNPKLGYTLSLLNLVRLSLAKLDSVKLTKYTKRCAVTGSNLSLSEQCQTFSVDYEFKMWKRRPN